MLPRLIKSVLLVFALSAAGCSDRVELHRQLSEQEANEVIAELADKQVKAQKIPTKNGVSVSVNAQDISRAVNALEAAGLPRATRSTLGEIFRKEGVISTPLEERARYIYALSQELEATLSKIDGVIVARVHVVLPERIAPGEPVQPASASVFIKHNSRLDPDSIQSRVRRLVAIDRHCRTVERAEPQYRGRITPGRPLRWHRCTIDHRTMAMPRLDAGRLKPAARTSRPRCRSARPDDSRDRLTQQPFVFKIKPAKHFHLRRAHQFGKRHDRHMVELIEQ